MLLRLRLRQRRLRQRLHCTFTIKIVSFGIFARWWIFYSFYFVFFFFISFCAVCLWLVASGLDMLKMPLNTHAHTHTRTRGCATESKSQLNKKERKNELDALQSQLRLQTVPPPHSPLCLPISAWSSVYCLVILSPTSAAIGIAIAISRLCCACVCACVCVCVGIF